MEIKDVPTTDIVPYPRNPRLIPDNAVRQVADSISRYGWQQPVVLDAEGVIIVGHTRLAAAQLLGMPTVPCYVADHLSPEQAQAYRLADNRTAENSAWDLDALTSEIDALAKATLDGVDFTVPGFAPDEIAAFLELAAPTEILPPPPPADNGRVVPKVAPPPSAPSPPRGSEPWWAENSLIARAVMVR